MRTLGVVIIHNSFEVFLLRRAHIIMIGDCLDIESTQPFCNCLDYTASFIHLVKDATGAPDKLAMAAAYHNPHYFVLSIRDFISTQFSTAGMDLPSAVIIRHLTLL